MSVYRTIGPLVFLQDALIFDCGHMSEIIVYFPAAISVVVSSIDVIIYKLKNN